MYILTKEEIQEDEILNEMHRLYLFHSRVIRDSAYPEPDSISWINYYKARRLQKQCEADSYRLRDIVDTRFYIQDHGTSSEQIILKMFNIK